MVWKVLPRLTWLLLWRSFSTEKSPLLGSLLWPYQLYLPTPNSLLHCSVWSPSHNTFTIWNCLAYLLLLSQLFLGPQLNDHRGSICPFHYLPGALRRTTKQILNTWENEQTNVIREKARVFGDFREGGRLPGEQKLFVKICTIRNPGQCDRGLRLTHSSMCASQNTHNRISFADVGGSSLLFQGPWCSHLSCSWQLFYALMI